ncbi:hypothetical protein [Eudoraea chungangensis]|uniref:hypothetical protein n=1 Tax=Eudoraea chungangensis TaxID=1481905 RepID=UPI0023EBA8CC|nr:hypothetical protein [Eudoraea chungangensis]
MRKNIFTLVIACAFIVLANPEVQAQEDSEITPMWEAITLTPDNTKLKILGENMRKHNQKYHKEGAHRATVYNITTGPNVGKIIWMMGPLQYKDLDSRPAVGGHDEDWRDNIMPYIKKMEHGEHWTQDVKNSNTSKLSGVVGDYPIQFIRYWEVNIDHSHNVQTMLEHISKTIKAMDGNNIFGVYYNAYRQGTRIGRHIATVSFYKNWTEFDEDPTFKQTYLKVHGENSWDAFIRNMDQVMDNSWDEIWVYDKNLSGN